PDTQRCLARLAFALGTHPESRALFLASGTQPDESITTRELAWSYYYAGDIAQALATISRYRQGQTVAKQGVWQAHALLDTIALYQRSNHPLPAEALQQASSIPDGPWPRPILAMQVGILTPDDLLKLASKLPADARAIALTEAYYYIGQHHLALNQTEQARAALLRIGVEGIRSSAVYQQAKVELDRLTPTSTAFQAAKSAFKDKRYDQALPILRKEAEAGLATAQLTLGGLYLHGVGVSKDQTEAVRWYQMAAAQNVAEAQNQLALAYESGAGIAQDRVKAIELLQRAAQLGDPHAQHNLAYRYDFGDGIAENQEQALHWYRQAAEQGLAAAQAALGYRYSEGQGLPKDGRLALRWSQRASSGGDSRGKYLLGYHYYHGLNVDKDLAKALQLYRASAELGYGDAQFDLARSLEMGLGIKPNQVEALKWYETAAKNNVVGAHSAIVRVRLLYGIGSKQEVIAAIQLLEQQAEKGESVAQFSLADMLEQGHGVKPNQALANTYYQRAADQGYNLAMRRMAHAYHDGKGLSKDMTKAMVWFKK
ncbi:MAG: SEL1-like repeat protein, partial [Chitinimonas sp.]|nr:SEL1-like repeat protein [Chitinimonas sp.]